MGAEERKMNDLSPPSSTVSFLMATESSFSLVGSCSWERHHGHLFLRMTSWTRACWRELCNSPVISDARGHAGSQRSPVLRDPSLLRLHLWLPPWRPAILQQFFQVALEVVSPIPFLCSTWRALVWGIKLEGHLPRLLDASDLTEVFKPKHTKSHRKIQHRGQQSLPFRPLLSR